jgi:hypothetical protein
MADERRLLVVANETVAGPELLGLIGELALAVRTRVQVVCPALNSPVRRWTSDEDGARHAAANRLAASLETLRAIGVDAKGEIGDADPLQAIADAVRVFSPDEVIISTHPEGRSNWLERDVVSAARERFDLPFRHVVVDLDALAQRSARDRATAAVGEFGASAEPHVGGVGARRLLVIANETVAGPELLAEIGKRVLGAPAEVFVVCPALNSPVRRWTSDEDGARRAAGERLATSLETLYSIGIDARGEIGDADPLQAMADALRLFAPDEVIISTHPEGRSNWLERDVVRAAGERFELPIRHVVVDLELLEPRQAATSGRGGEPAA